MSHGLACDWDDCDSWALAGPMQAGWLAVTINGSDRVRHYCSGWHLTQDTARWSEPSTVVER